MVSPHETTGLQCDLTSHGISSTPLLGRLLEDNGLGGDQKKWPLFFFLAIASTFIEEFSQTFSPQACRLSVLLPCCTCLNFTGAAEISAACVCSDDSHGCPDPTTSRCYHISLSSPSCKFPVRIKLSTLERHVPQTNYQNSLLSYYWCHHSHSRKRFFFILHSAFFCLKMILAMETTSLTSSLGGKAENSHSISLHRRERWRKIRSLVASWLHRKKLQMPLAV